MNNKKTSYGTSVVIDKSWFWNPIECWENYPMQELTPEVQNYYFLGCAHALSLCLTLFTDIVRKDFKAKIVHHAATLCLLVFSYVCGYTRLGCLGELKKMKKEQVHFSNVASRWFWFLPRNRKVFRLSQKAVFGGHVFHTFCHSIFHQVIF